MAIREPEPIWAVNASKDGRVVVSAESDGAIHWRRAEDGHELLALQVLPNKKRTEQVGLGAVDARRLLRGDARRSKCVEMGRQSRSGQRGDDTACVGYRKLHRPDALPLVLQELETAQALGIADWRPVTGVQKRPAAPNRLAGRCTCSRSASTSSATRRAACTSTTRLRTRAISRTRCLRARRPLRARRACTPRRWEYLPNDKAVTPPFSTRSTARRKRCGKTVGSGRRDRSGLDPRGDVPRQVLSHPLRFRHQAPRPRRRIAPSRPTISPTGARISRARKSAAAARRLPFRFGRPRGLGDQSRRQGSPRCPEHGKCHCIDLVRQERAVRGASGLEAWRPDEAFLDALTGAADAQGIVRLSALTDAMENELRSLTKGRQQPRHARELRRRPVHGEPLLTLEAGGRARIFHSSPTSSCAEQKSRLWFSG